MGPVFNADQCFVCHSQPQIGGSSPKANPAKLIAHRLGGTNVVPRFEAPDGAFRETRFKFNSDGTRDGGVHSLFTLQGRSDAPGCTLHQPDFEQELHRRNVAYRIPLQLFGLGLIESIQDKAIMANMNSAAREKRFLGIGGHPNLVANNGTISRFGWKAQNASINMFAGEAYNVEMGITNDLFPISRSEDDYITTGRLPGHRASTCSPRGVRPRAGAGAPLPWPTRHLRLSPAFLSLEKLALPKTRGASLWLNVTMDCLLLEVPRRGGFRTAPSFSTSVGWDRRLAARK